MTRFLMRYEDTCYYAEVNGFECNHYFGGLRIQGCKFSGFEKEVKEAIENNFDSVETFFEQKELKELFNLNDELKNLGYGIEKGSEKYNKGMELLDKIENILKKLDTDEAEIFHENIVKDEMKKIKEYWNLEDEDIKYIRECYDNENMFDRECISYIYENAYNLGEEEVKSCYSFDSALDDYIDYERFGNDLIDDYYYIELSNGRVAYMSY